MINDVKQNIFCDFLFFFLRLTYYTMKNGPPLLLLKTDECAFQTKGVVFFKATKGVIAYFVTL